MIKLNCKETFYVAEDSLKSHTTIALKKGDDPDYECSKEDIPTGSRITEETITTKVTKNFLTGKETSGIESERYYFVTPLLKLTINGKSTKLYYDGAEAFEKRDSDYNTLAHIMEDPKR